MKLPEQRWRELVPQTTYCCENCGSDDVVRDAWAAWDSELQMWVADQIFDNAYCRSCEGETSLKEVKP